MTVIELINKLYNVPPDAAVVIVDDDSRFLKIMIECEDGECRLLVNQPKIQINYFDDEDDSYISSKTK